MFARRSRPDVACACGHAFEIVERVAERAFGSAFLRVCRLFHGA
jgi:hypothetical protein